MPGGPNEPGVYVTYQWQTRTVCKTLASLSMLLGYVLVVGGPARFASPGFATAREVPGQHLTWGGLFIAAGLLAWCGIGLGWHRRTVMAGLFAMACLFGFLSLALADTAVHDTRTAFTGVIVYGGMSVMCITAWAAGHGLKS